MEQQPEHHQNEKKHEFVAASALRLGFLILLIFLSIMIIKPFIIPVFWGIIIAIGIYPFFQKISKLLGNREKLTATLFTLFFLAVIIVPSIMFTSNTVEGLQKVMHQMETGSLLIPPPPQEVAEWPLVGKPIHEIWELATTNLEAAILKMEPQIKEYTPKLLSAVAGLGMTILQFIISILIAGVFLVSANPAGVAADRIFKLLIGVDGKAFTTLAEGTIRSVVQGVLGIAVIQAFLAGVGMWAVGMPGTGIWVLLVLMLAIMQLPPALILIPIATYVFTMVDTTPAVIFLIWSILVSVSDAFLKPMFLGRGVDIPMIVILLGAIGGMMLSGIIGLFVGAVILAIAYKVFGNVIKRNDTVADEN